MQPFTAYDETYLHSQLQGDNNVLAEREIKADQKKDRSSPATEPYTWTRTYGKGKVFYTAYGHDERTWNQPGFQSLIYNAILWSVNEDALKAFNARNPIAFEYKGNLLKANKNSSIQSSQSKLIKLAFSFNINLSNGKEFSSKISKNEFTFEIYETRKEL